MVICKQSVRTNKKLP